MKQRCEGDTKSAIINLTSVYSWYTNYNAPIFTSAKSFSDVFSQNLYYENQDMDILTVQNMPTKSPKSPLGVDPRETVEGVLMDLGHERISYGHANHSLLRYWILLQQC
jgi:short-subunit dehydrogenase